MMDTGETSMDRKHRERIKLEVLLRPADRQALQRYCDFFNVTLTQFIASRAREYERRTLQRLNKEQRALYLAGDLLWSEMSEQEHDAFRDPPPAVLHGAADFTRQVGTADFLGHKLGESQAPPSQILREGQT
jgi:hypothetical protein